MALQSIFGENTSNMEAWPGRCLASSREPSTAKSTQKEMDSDILGPDWIGPKQPLPSQLHPKAQETASIIYFLGTPSLPQPGHCADLPVFLQNFSIIIDSFRGTEHLTTPFAGQTSWKASQTQLSSEHRPSYEARSGQGEPERLLHRNKAILPHTCHTKTPPQGWGNRGYRFWQNQIQRWIIFHSFLGGVGVTFQSP